MNILKILIFVLMIAFTTNTLYSKDISQKELNNIIKNKLQELYASQEVQDYMAKIWASDKFLDFKKSKEYQSNSNLVRLDKEITNRKNVILNDLRKSNPRYDSLFNEIASRKRRYAGEWEGSDEYIKILYEDNQILLDFDKDLEEKIAKDNILLNLNLQYGNAFRKDTKLMNLFNLKFPEVDKFIKIKINKLIEEVSKKYGQNSKVIPNKDIQNNDIQFTTYSSEENPKANGLNFTIKYPSNWEVVDGKNPHILKVFKYTYNEFKIMIMIQVQNLGTSKSNDELKAEIDNMSDKEIKQLMKPYITTEYEKKEYNNQPGMCLYTFYNQRIGLEWYNIVGINHMIYFHDIAIMIMCQTWASETIPTKQLAEETNKYLPLFSEIANSFSINNKEEYSTKTHIRKSSFFQDLVSMMYKEEGLKELPESILIFLLIFSFVLTWGICLGEPIIIRYLILKRPMTKESAIITSIILCIINMAIFIALGSKSRMHTALLIAAYISYLILKKKSKNNNKDNDKISDDKKIENLLKESKFFKDKKEG